MCAADVSPSQALLKKAYPQEQSRDTGWGSSRRAGAAPQPDPILMAGRLTLRHDFRRKPGQHVPTLQRPTRPPSKKQALLLSPPPSKGSTSHWHSLVTEEGSHTGPLLRIQLCSVSSESGRCPASPPLFPSSSGWGYVGTGRLSWKKRFSVQTCRTATSSSTATLAADQKLTRSRLSS